MGCRYPAPIAGVAPAEVRFDLDVSGLFPEDLAPVELEMRVDHPAHPPARRCVRAEASSMSGVEIPLRLAALLRGRVLDTAGVPVAG